MSGRRSHSRFGFGSEGVLRVLRDVDVHGADRSEVVVISSDPAIAGDVMTIELVEGEGVTTRVEVVESRLVTDDGRVRYALRLRPISESQRGAWSNSGAADDPEQR